MQKGFIKILPAVQKKKKKCVNIASKSLRTLALFHLILPCFAILLAQLSSEVSICFPLMNRIQSQRLPWCMGSWFDWQKKYYQETYDM